MQLLIGMSGSVSISPPPYLPHKHNKKLKTEEDEMDPNMSKGLQNSIQTMT